MKLLEDGAVFRDLGWKFIRRRFFLVQKKIIGTKTFFIKLLGPFLYLYEGRSVFNDIHQTSDLFQELYQKLFQVK